MAPLARPFPRELAPGLHWLGECQRVEFRGGMLHSYNAPFLVTGSESTVLLEAGWPTHVDVLIDQLDQLLDDPAALRWIWLTHQETPHAGGVGRLLELFPNAVAVGDVRDYHLFFPELEHRFQPMVPGDTIDLGDREIMIVEPVIMDLATTQWAFDTGSKALFPGDGFAYAHHHMVGQCGLVLEEIEHGELDVVSMSAVFAYYALHWMKFVDMAPYGKRLQALIDELRVELICPTHGAPITDVATAIPLIADAMMRVNGALEELLASTTEHE